MINILLSKMNHCSNRFPFISFCINHGWSRGIGVRGDQRKALKSTLIIYTSSLHKGIITNLISLREKNVHRFIKLWQFVEQNVGLLLKTSLKLHTLSEFLWSEADIVSQRLWPNYHTSLTVCVGRTSLLTPSNTRAMATNFFGLSYR